jgi:hypothetical protein
MWLFSESLFDYLKARTTGQKIADMVVVIAVFTWIAAAYIVATNYSAIKQALFTQAVDMKSLIQLDKSINEILYHMMNNVGSDRAALARFHNTISDVQGRHFVYESRSNEVVQPGVSMVAQLRQNLLVSMINIWAQSFIKNECVYMTDIAQTDLFYEFYRQIGNKSDIKCPVYNTSNALVGWISAEFTTRSVSMKDMKIKELLVRDAASKIGAILSVKAE